MNTPNNFGNGNPMGGSPMGGNPMGGQPMGGQEQPQGQQQAPSSNHLFDKVGNATPSEGGVYALAGVYPALYIDAVKLIKSRAGDDLFVAEFCILNSDVPERGAGTRMSWMANFKHDAAPGNIRQFLAAAMNIPVDGVDAQGSQYACSAQNPLHGRLIRLEASQIKTRANNDFTKCTWFSIGDEHQAKSGEWYAQAGFGAPAEPVPY